jgi:hypothetical protein
VTKRVVVQVAITLAVLSCIDHAAANDGWIRLLEDQVKEQGWRDVSPTRFLSANMDIDGDGKKDVAAIVVSRDSKKSAIRICFGDATRRPQCHVVAESENISDVMGLERKSPGCYAYREDASGNLSRGEKICGRADLLEYFKFGSASSFFLYKDRSRKFERYWDSD